MTIIRSLLIAGLMFAFVGCNVASIVPNNMGLISNSVQAVSKATRTLSPEEEFYVGRAVAARILGTYPQAKDKELINYLNSVGQTVALHSEVPATFGGYHFALLNGEEPNAFACPGGIIFITTGMLAATRNEDELAAVLAHEIAHVNHRDGVEAIQKSRWTEAATVIGTEAAKNYGGREVAQLVTLFEGSIDDVFKTLVVNGYGRSQELAADSSALAILGRSGYDPAALKDFLGRLAGQGKSAGGIMNTHPATDERIENMQTALTGNRPSEQNVDVRTRRFTEILKGETAAPAKEKRPKQRKHAGGSAGESAG